MDDLSTKTIQELTEEEVVSIRTGLRNLSESKNMNRDFSKIIQNTLENSASIDEYSATMDSFAKKYLNL